MVKIELAATNTNTLKDLKSAVAKQLPEDKVESVVYPKYETSGELAQASEGFLEW